MNVKRLVVAAFVVILAVGIVVPAAAVGDWQLSYSGQGNNNLWSGQSRTVDYYWGGAWLSKSLYAGAFDMRVLAGPTGHPSQIWTYCIDLTNVSDDDWYRRYAGIKAPDGTDGTRPTMTDRAWQDLAWLIQMYFDDSLTNKDKSAGFQLAVWDVLFGNDYSLTGGNFKATDFGTFGQGYLNALSAARGGSFTDYTANTVFYVDGQSQMAKSVPEFPPAMLAPLGAAAIGLLRRRLFT